MMKDIRNGDIIFIRQNVSLYNKWSKRPAIVEGVFDEGIQCSSFDDGETMYSIPIDNIKEVFRYDEKNEIYYKVGGQQ